MTVFHSLLFLDQLIALLEQVSKQRLSVRAMPWPLLKVASLFSADLRGVLSLRYLWDTGHRIDATRLRELLPDFVSVSPVVGLSVALFRLHEKR